MPQVLMVILASSDQVVRVLLWSGLFVGAVLALVLVLLGIRKWIASTGPSSLDPPFTLDQLRQMRARDEITEQQFEQLKSRVVAMSGGPVRKDNVSDVGNSSPTDAS